MDIFAERLKLLRNKKNLSQSQVGERINTTDRGYRNYEIGASKPNYQTLLKLADIFDVSLDYLAGRTDDPTPPAKKAD